MHDFHSQMDEQLPCQSFHQTLDDYGVMVSVLNTYVRPLLQKYLDSVSRCEYGKIISLHDRCSTTSITGNPSERDR